MRSKADGRIKAIAGMIRGEIIADVGSDHAYLPIWLYLNNKIKKAYAVDISENCVNRIKKNIKKYNISEDIIIPVLSDGLTKINDFDKISDIIIAGMGGETIAGILEKAQTPAVCGRHPLSKGGLNYILQPNSKIKFLREFLHNNDFEIIQDIIVESKKRFYTIINAYKRL